MAVFKNLQVPSSNLGHSEISKIAKIEFELPKLSYNEGLFLGFLKEDLFYFSK